jgi:hypothetical protein
MITALRSRSIFTVTVFFMVALLAALGASAAEPADLVVRRANVFTSETNRPHATAFAVREGKFAAVGDETAVAAFIGPKTIVLELAGKTIVPGFIDAHLHPQPVYPEGSRWASVDCRPSAVRNMDELIAALRRKAEQTPPGLWVTGSRYQEPETIKDITIEATWIGGRKVWAAARAAE